MEKENYLVLNDILQTINVPLDEIQAWSICYQLLHSSGCFDFDPSSIMDAYSIKTVKDIDLKNITIYSNGEVRSLRGEQYSDFTENDMLMWLNGVGGLLYRCLDYGLGDGEERELGADIIRLIEELTSAAEKRDDEGIGEIEDGLPLSIIHRVKEMCLNVSGDRCQTPGLHQIAVCRALYWHAVELGRFLNDVSDTRVEDEDHRHLLELDKHAWASLWQQLMADLRRGVRLRAVKNSEQLPSHERLFELTPYEMLLEDIRLRRYHLKPLDRVPVPLHLRASAHEMILEYIRSRPPLRPATRRALKSRPAPTLTAREATLDKIRQRAFALRAVEWPQENKFALPRPRRKLRSIKPDFNLDDLSDEDAAFPELLSRVADPASIRRRRIAPLPSTASEFRGLRRRATFASEQDLQLRRNPFVSPRPRKLLNFSSESNSSSLAFEGGSSCEPSPHFDASRHRFSVSDLPSPPSFSSRPRSSSLAPTADRSPLVRHRSSLDGSFRPHLGSVQSLQLENCLPESEDEMEAGDLCNFSSFRVPRSKLGLGPGRSSLLEEEEEAAGDLSESKSPFRSQGQIRRSVRLNLSEVSLIRSTLARAEVESMSTNSKMYQKLKQERICFCCRKTEFGLLRWGKRCSMCQRSVCSDCRKKTALPRDRAALVGDFLVNSLAPNDSPKRGGKGLARRSSFLGGDSRASTELVCLRCAEIDLAEPQKGRVCSQA